MNTVALGKHSDNLVDNLSETSTESGEGHENKHLSTAQSRKKWNQAQNSKAKSSLCRNFMEKGLCPYGPKCQFAHGSDQLKCNSNQHMSYKTRACHGFARKGYCPYGERCNFVHIVEPVEIVENYTTEYREIMQEVKHLKGSLLLQILG